MKEETVTSPSNPDLESASPTVAGVNAESTLLKVEDLRVTFFTPAGPVNVLEGVNFSVGSGEILGIVGETGAGKSVTALSIVQLLQRPGRVVGGRILFRGVDLNSLRPNEMRGVRGAEISMIFQNPRSSLNPVFRVGKVVREVLRVHSGLKGSRGRCPGDGTVRRRWAPRSGIGVTPVSAPALGRDGTEGDDRNGARILAAPSPRR